MLGGSFAWHPPLQAFTVRVVDRDHPSTSSFAEKDWQREDEFYFMKDLEPGLRVLMAGDTGQLVGLERMPDTVTEKPSPYPLVWCRELGRARVWYSALGHKSGHYEDPVFLEHLQGGILWTLGLK
jgi:type 1 glutamine amidotransferase